MTRILCRQNLSPSAVQIRHLLRLELPGEGRQGEGVDAAEDDEGHQGHEQVGVAVQEEQGGEHQSQVGPVRLLLAAAGVPQGLAQEERRREAGHVQDPALMSDDDDNLNL